MITPAGDECRFYYQDFHRGRSVQVCRLLEHNPQSEPWQPSVCRSCPVPRILQANGSPHLALELVLKRRWFFWRCLLVSAVCSKHQVKIADPYVGCLQCQAENPGVAALLGQTPDE